jgi:antitoxin YefM
MRHTSLADFHADIAKFFDEVEADRIELVVTRQSHEPCVVMPLAELEGLRETLRLLATRANAEHIFRSLAELDAGKGKERALAEP